MSWAWPFCKEPPESPLPSSWRSTTRHFTASWTWGGGGQRRPSGAASTHGHHARRAQFLPPGQHLREGQPCPDPQGPTCRGEGPAVSGGAGHSRGHRLLCQWREGSSQEASPAAAQAQPSSDL